MTASWMLVGRRGAVDDEVALGVARRHREEVLADRVVEGVGLGLEPVVDVAASAPALLGARRRRRR